MNTRKTIGGGLAVLVILATMVPLGASATSEDSAVSATVGAPRGTFNDYLTARFASTNRDSDAAANHYVLAVASDPFNVVLVRQAFSLAVTSGRIDDAIRMARRLVDLQEKPTGLMNLVLVVGDVSENKLAAARERVDAMPRSGIVALMAPLISSWIWAAEGNVDAALADLEGLEKNRGFMPFMKAHKAYILDFSGRIPEAEAAYQDAIAHHKGADLRLVLAYGRFMERLGESGRAVEAYGAYVENYPSNVLIEEARRRASAGEKPAPLIGSVSEGTAEAFFSTGRALAQERSRTSAIVYLQLARALRKDFPVANLMLGTVLDQDGRSEASLNAFQNVVDDPVLGWDARYESAMLMARTDRSDDAIAALEEMVNERPNELAVISSLADTLRTAERYEEARSYYDRAIGGLTEPVSRHWALYYSRAVSLEQLGDWPAAEADFKTALELEPDQPLVLNYLGYSWVEKGQNLDEALAMIERAVEQRPSDGYIVDSLGWALYHLGQYEEAVAWLEKAIQLKPEDPTINDHLGDAYWQAGRRLEASFQWRHALAMKPLEKDVAKIKDKIASGLGSEQHSGN